MADIAGAAGPVQQAGPPSKGITKHATFAGRLGKGGRHRRRGRRG